MFTVISTWGGEAYPAPGDASATRETAPPTSTYAYACIHVSIGLSICLSIYPASYLYIGKDTCQEICAYIYTYIHLYLSISISIYPPLSLALFLSLSPSLSLSAPLPRSLALSLSCSLSALSPHTPGRPCWYVRTSLYRGTSLIRNSPPPQDPPRTLGIVLL